MRDRGLPEKTFMSPARGPQIFPSGNEIQKACFYPFGNYSPTRQPIACPLASISDHFRGRFIPNLNNQTPILPYSQNQVPEFAILCNPMRFRSLFFGGGIRESPTEKPGRERETCVREDPSAFPCHLSSEKGRMFRSTSPLHGGLIWNRILSCRNLKRLRHRGIFS